MDRNAIAFDTETSPIRPGCLAPRLVCLQYHYPGHPEPQIVLRDEAITLFESWLDAGCSFVAANTAFDMGVMWANAPHLKAKIWAAYNEGRVYDLAIYEMLRKIELGTLGYCPVLRTVPYFGLWEPVLEHLHIDIRADKKGPDIWRGRYNELDGVPLAQWPQKALKYALDDARYARAIHDLQCSRPIEDYQRQVRYAWSLHLTSAWGLRTEAQMVADLKKRIRGNVDAARPVLIKEGILRPKRVFRPWEVSEGLLQQSDYSVSEKVVRERVTRALGDRATLTNPSKTHPNGQVSIAESELWKSEDPGLITLAQIGKDLTELSTFIPLLEQGTQYPINTRFGMAASGRVTSGKDRESGRGGNTQNLPRRKGVRECFVPRYGYAYGFCDYSAAELCGQAQVCRDLYGWSELAKVFERGQDPHVVTASLLVGKSYQDVYDAIKRGEKWAKDARQLCKIANFGYPGGLSAATFIDYARGQTRRADGTYPDYILALDLATSTRLRDIVLAAYPEWQCVFDDAKRACAGGYGRRLQHRSNRWRGGLTFTSWCNTGFQGVVADGAKHALYLVQHECWNVPTSPLYGCRVVNFVHDEIIMEIPVARVHEALARLEIVMLDGMRAFIPDVPLKVESAAAMRWYKGAEPVIVDGRVVPGKPIKVGDRTEWIEDTTWRLAA